MVAAYHTGDRNEKWEGEGGADRARHAVGAVETLGHGPWATLVGNFS